MKYLLIICSVAMLFSCAKRNQVWVHYMETQCADPWGPHDSDNGLMLSIETFFFDKGAPIVEIKIVDTDLGEACSACGCLSGRKIQALVHKDNEGTLLEHGFLKGE